MSMTMQRKVDTKMHVSREGRGENTVPDSVRPPLWDAQDERDARLHLVRLLLLLVPAQLLLRHRGLH